MVYGIYGIDMALIWHCFTRITSLIPIPTGSLAMSLWPHGLLRRVQRRWHSAVALQQLPGLADLSFQALQLLEPSPRGKSMLGWIGNMGSRSSILQEMFCGL